MSEMKRLLAVLVVALGAASLVHAVPIDCRTMFRMDQYLAQSLDGGCFVQDKLFTDFFYTGGGSATAADVLVDTVFAVLPGQDIHGFVITTMGAEPVWTTSFSWGYTITIFPPNPLLVITSAKLQGNFGNIPPNPAMAVSTKTNGLVQDVFLGDETEIDTFTGVTTLGSRTDVTIPTGGFLISLEETYTQQLIPEPAAATLLGIGLVALGIVARRRSRSR
jgi:hypothetical protein